MHLAESRNKNNNVMNCWNPKVRGRQFQHKLSSLNEYSLEITVVNNFKRKEKRGEDRDWRLSS